ncbi:MAG TPA: arginine--tRNA ligase, partial [Desulfotomaculum sp.]|nr:arginine--tRNA ligase [Desulfotomaculum sp.]
MSSAVDQMKENLAGALKRTVKKAVRQGVLQDLPELPDFIIEVPREKDHGDFAANLAMLLSKKVHLPPRKVAEILKGCIDFQGLPVEKVEVAGPGFINFYLDPKWVLEILPGIITLDENYGRT